MHPGLVADGKTLKGSGTVGYNEGAKIREVLIKRFLLKKIASYSVIFSFFVHLANLSQLLSVV